MISQTAEYALRAVVFLGNSGGVPQTTAQISDATHAPPSYLSKVMQQLCRAGIVGSQRGLHGGFTITGALDEVTVLGVIDAVDPISRIRECPLGNKAHGTNLCPLHRCMDDALASAQETFANVTVESLLETPQRGQVCRFPGVCKGGKAECPASTTP